MSTRAHKLADDLEKKCQNKVNDMNAAYDRYGWDNTIEKNFPTEFEIIKVLRSL